MNKPYTYVIGWSVYNKFYYGVRYARGCCSTDLWVTYFTSSKLVKKLREDIGEPDIIEVRKEFDCVILAQKWEKRVLRRLKIYDNDKWLNGNIGGAIDPKIVKEKLTGRTLSIETKNKMRIAKLGRKTGRPAWNKGLKGAQKHSEETKKYLSEIRVGAKHTEETKEKIRSSLLNR